MAHKLTKVQKANAEQRRISQLTSKHSAYFKAILSHQLENGYGFTDLHRQSSNHGLNAQDLLKVLRAFGQFFDDSLQLTITEAQNKYMRPTDNSDGTHDPETNTTVQVQHFCLFAPNTQPQGHSDSVRIHGYFRVNGYFIITRLDWYHNVHSA